MNIVKEDTFRSPGKGVNMTDDMIRVTIDFTAQEFKNFKNNVVSGPSYPLLCANADTPCVECPNRFKGKSGHSNHLPSYLIQALES